jgi:hypothetical protein
MKTSSKAFVSESKQRLIQARNNIKGTLGTSDRGTLTPAKLTKKSIGIPTFFTIF